MESKFVIIGGGIAGLAAAIRLMELGEKPLIIDAGSYPRHKVCGEFFSPEAVPLLHRWGINPIPVKEALFHWHGKMPMTFQFPCEAGSLSHYHCDSLLMEKAKSGGACFLPHKQVQGIKRSKEKRYKIVLATGEVIEAEKIIIAVGRLPGILPSLPHKFMGLKSHFTNISLDNRLEMFLFPGAYLGMTPIEDGKVNIACLVDQIEYNEWNDPQLFIHYLSQQNRKLNDYLVMAKPLFPDWMTAPLPAFGVKASLDWPDTYCVGDAIGTIPPITGMGLTMALKGGVMAAEYSVKGAYEPFKIAWKKEFGQAITLGKLLHGSLKNRILGPRILNIGKRFPFLTKKVYLMTRIKE